MMSPRFAFRETEPMHEEITLIAIEICDHYFSLEKIYPVSKRNPRQKTLILMNKRNYVVQFK